MNDIDLYAVPPYAVDEVWSEISPFIQKGLDYAHGEMGIDDVKQMVLNDVVVPIVMAHQGKVLAVVTMEISEKPSKRVMSLMTAGGEELENWLDEFMHVADKLAIEQGVDAIYVTGRKGWEKKLRRYGYNYAYTVLARQIQ